MLDITSHQENRNKNQTIPFHNPWHGNFLKKKENNKCWRGGAEINITPFLYKKVPSIIIRISKKKNQKPPKCPSVDILINKTQHMHTTTKKKNEMTYSVTWLNIENILK